MRNKTIILTDEEREEYLKKAIVPTSSSIEEGCVFGDAFDALKLIKPHSVDLLIVDPPYNLSKNFDGVYFNARSSAEYVEYTEKWLSLCLPLLKENASIYVCCDWKCSNEIASVLSAHATVKNRITWQREKGRGAKANWKNSTEDIWFAVTGDNYKFNLDAVKQRRKVIAPYKKDGEPKDWEETPDGKFRDTCPSNFWDDISVPY
ncbi:MAG: site-specific DNA-methyltransferase, partial [Clostridia bacterium]|nr:site-specific DNA-methyltransferase [Clostridia bacterium]